MATEEVAVGVVKLGKKKETDMVDLSSGCRGLSMTSLALFLHSDPGVC